MRRILSFSLLIIFLTTLTISANNIKLDLDDAVFLDKTGLYRWEMYYSFEESELVFKKMEEGLLGEMFFHIKVSSNIKVEAEKKWIVSHLKNETNSSQSIFLNGQKDFLLNPGQYKVNVYVQNYYDSSSFAELNFDLLIRDTKKLPFSISSIECAQVIVDTSTSQIQWNNAFIKHNSYVIPIPSLTYLATQQSLSSYIEIYNNTSEDTRTINLKYELIDAFENVMNTYNNNISVGAQSSMYDFNSFPLIDHPSGIYYLKVLATHADNNNDSISMIKKVFLLNPDQKISNNSRFLESQIFEKSEFSSLTPEQTDIEITKIKPLASREELDQFNLLSTTEAKQRMLFKFWQARDLDTSDSFNESLFKFKDMVKFAQNYFSHGFTPGWMTDRGKTVIKYGLPGNRLQYPFKGNQRPYEEWFYEDVQGGVYFYFVDVFANGNFELVHSTAYGEIQYDNWYNEYVLKNQSRQNDDNIINPGW